MDRKSWPWKKKSSDKSVAEKIISTLDSAGASLNYSVSLADKGSKDGKYKRPNYVEISVETYTHLTGLENQVKTYEEQVETYEDQLKTMEEEINELNEKLSSANSEIKAKEELVKQHAKVAEEAVSGWEKAEAEALTLKNHLESVTLAKLTIEDRASHLDGALKECMRQIRTLNEENEQKLQQVLQNKNKQFERMKHELEMRIGGLDRELMKAEAETASLSRSLQERYNTVIRINEEKSKAEAEIELLKSEVESSEREINSLKYELHIVSKELDIRNEEKNMSVKTAEVANKQHLEGVKKIAKLEAECQRLRGLVRKKLPGPAALAQMKMEVESLGRDNRARRSPSRPASPQYSLNPHMLHVPELSLDGAEKFQKENGFLTERLLAMEEETKMLKEALAKRNGELQTSRSICAKTANKLQSLEAQLLILNQQKGSLKTDIRVVEAERSHHSQNVSDPPSMTSLSEDGNDDAVSCAESWGFAMISKAENRKHLQLMDDFEQMEKLAGLSDDRNSAISKLQSRITTIFESVANEYTDVVKIMDDIKFAVQEIHDTLHPVPVNCVFEEKHCSERANNQVILPDDGVSTAVDAEPNKFDDISRDLIDAISLIYNFVLSLGKDTTAVDGVSEHGDKLSEKVDEFSAVFNKVIHKEVKLDSLIFALSDVMAKACEFRFNVREANSPDCIDKVALSYSNGCGLVDDRCPNPEVPQEADIVSAFDSVSCKFSVEEEFEQLKADKNRMEREYFRSSQDLEMAKSRIGEMERMVEEVKSELVTSRKMNGLSETQLKCMAESYKTLEERAEELEKEVRVLRAHLGSLADELEAEKSSHRDALSRCKDLEEQLQRNEGCSMCSSSVAVVDEKTKQEKELAAAAEKLAECQETIFLLGKHLKSFRPLQQEELTGSPNSDTCHQNEAPNEEEPATSGTNFIDLNQNETEIDAETSTTTTTIQRLGFHSSLCTYNNTTCTSDNEPNPLTNPRHRPTKSSGSSTCSTPTPEKHSRSLSRFFSSKGKNNH